MKMTAGQRALDKIFKRRDRYEIPDWQRTEVWNTAKKQDLIDSILRGWKLPKFYFVGASDEEFEVVDGQQRLNAIYEFFSNELALSDESQDAFGGRLYRDLPTRTADAYDDFEIEYDLIEDATDQEVKEFFQRLQGGMPLTTSERLNAVSSKLRDFCKNITRHPFFKESIKISDTRYAHFDIMSKVAAVEIEGLDAGLRFDDIKGVFDSQKSFSSTSAIGKRIRSALDLLHKAFDKHGESLRTRTVVQSLITLACRLVLTGKTVGLDKELRPFFEAFTKQLTRQVELGQAATDSDYLIFQRSVNANVKGAAKSRHEILLRKLFQLAPHIAERFDPSIVAESGVSGRVKSVGSSIIELVGLINDQHGKINGEDLFKATNKTTQALIQIGKAAKDVQGYETFVDNLYFLFRESVGTRLGDKWPSSFTDVKDLRTDLRHDVDHGKTKDVKSKRKKAGSVFAKYAGGGTAETIDPSKLPLVQANILTAIEGDLRGLLQSGPASGGP